jgi:diphthamide synthase (EF-2-diphthine--ammonia ligase)
MSTPKKKMSVEKKAPVNGEPKIKVGIAWFQRDQWQLLANVSVDRDELEGTYAQWKRNAEKALEQLRQGGLDVVKVHVKIEELMDWCLSQNIPLDANARSRYAAEKLQKLVKRVS